MEGAQRRAERRGVARLQLLHLGVEHVGHHLQHVPICRRPPGGVDRRDPDAHPAAVERERHHLRLDDGADVGRRIGCVERVAPHARLEHERSDLRIEPRQHRRAAVSGRRAPERCRECRPVHPVVVAHTLPRQRSVLEHRHPHIRAGRRRKHVTGAIVARARGRHDAEDRVARAERDGDNTFANEARADQAAWIVAGPRDDARGRQVMPLLPIRRERAQNRPRLSEWRKLRVETWCGRSDCLGRTIALPPDP